MCRQHIINERACFVEANAWWWCPGSSKERLLLYKHATALSQNDASIFLAAVAGLSPTATVPFLCATAHTIVYRYYEGHSRYSSRFPQIVSQSYSEVIYRSTYIYATLGVAFSTNAALEKPTPGIKTEK